MLFGTVMSLSPLLFYPGPWSTRSVLVMVSICVFFLVLTLWRLRKLDAPAKTTGPNEDRFDFFAWCITAGFLTVAYLLSGSHFVRALLAAVFFWGVLPWVRKEWGLSGDAKAC